MELLKLALKEHRGLIVLAAGALALIIAFSVVRCTTVQAQRVQAAQAEGGVSVQTAGSANAGSNDGNAQAESVESKALAKLSDSQRERQSAYDEDTARFVAELSSNIWTARNDKYFLTFTPTIYTDRADEKETVHPYVISDLMPRGTKSSDQQTVETQEAVIETDEGSSVLTYTVTTDKKSGKKTVKIASSAFSIYEEDGYTRSGAADNALTVGEVNSSFSAMIDGKTDAMEKALRDFCASNYPTATKATWRSSVTCDWKEKTVVTWFDLNNSSKSSVSITYSTDKGEFKVENSYSASERG